MISEAVANKIAAQGIIKKSGDRYVALCLELNVSSQGECIVAARKMLQEAAQNTYRM